MKKRGYYVILLLLLLWTFCVPAYADRGTVPDVTGLYLDEAQAKLREAGFCNITAKENANYSSKVTAQSVKANSVVNTTRVISLDVKRECFVTLEISSAYNLIFSKYAIDVYSGSGFMGTVDNGDSIKLEFCLLEDDYVFTFYKHGTSEFETQYVMHVTGDGTYSVKLGHSSSGITIDKDSQDIAAVGNAIALPNFVGKKADSGEVSNLYGKVNYSFDCSENEKGNRIIVSQSIAPSSWVNKHRTIEFTTVDFDLLLQETFVEKPINEIFALAQDKLYTISIVNFYTGKDISESINAIPDEEIELWHVNSAKDATGNAEQVVITAYYDGPVTFPKVNGKTYAEALALLEEKNLVNGTVNNLTGEDVRLADRWKIVAQSVAPDTVVNSLDSFSIDIERINKPFKFSYTGKDNKTQTFPDVSKKYTFKIKPSDVTNDDWEVVLSDRTIATVEEQKTYSKSGKNYISFKIVPLKAGTVEFHVLSAYDESSEQYSLTIKDYLIPSSYKIDSTSVEMEIGDRDEMSFTLPYFGITWNDINLELGKSSLASITKGDVVYGEYKTTFYYTIKAKKKGKTNLTISSKEGNWSQVLLKLAIKARERRVYVTTYGECYHYSSSCAGKNAREIPLSSAGRYRPCKKCVK